MHCEEKLVDSVGKFVACPWDHIKILRASFKFKDHFKYNINVKL